MEYNEIVSGENDCNLYLWNLTAELHTKALRGLQCCIGSKPFPSNAALLWSDSAQHKHTVARTSHHSDWVPKCDGLLKADN